MHATRYTLSRGDDDLELEIEYTVAPYDPGCTFGPPEYCYPPEGGEVEELAAYHKGEPVTLTDAERERIEEHIYATHEYLDR